jgi:hypothetical protein
VVVVVVVVAVVAAMVAVNVFEPHNYTRGMTKAGSKHCNLKSSQGGTEVVGLNTMELHNSHV